MTAHAPPAHGQTHYPVRLEWGSVGAHAVSSGVGCAVVVDALSFTTAVTIAVEQGVAVLPYRWRDRSASEYAAARGAVLAVGRREGMASGAPSLSPASLVGLDAGGRLLLPSPNGSAIAFELGAAGVVVVAACLRNVTAVCDWLAPRAAAGVALVAAGERWPDGSLRPAVEDLWGAGAVASGLLARGVVGLSPEAQAAAAAYDRVAGDLLAHLRDCASGRELVDAGFAADVALASVLDGSPVLPVLTPDRDAFR